MTDKAMRIDIRGIKCDNPLCDYEDLEVAFDPDKYLDMPCPLCGESLFTPEDYKLMETMMKITALTKDAFKDIDLSGNATMGVMLGMNGTGNLKFGDITHVPGSK